MIPNLSCYRHGIMGYGTANTDRPPREGMIVSGIGSMNGAYRFRQAGNAVVHLLEKRAGGVNSVGRAQKVNMKKPQAGSSHGWAPCVSGMPGPPTLNESSLQMKVEYLSAVFWE